MPTCGDHRSRHVSHPLDEAAEPLRFGGAQLNRQVETARPDQGSVLEVEGIQLDDAGLGRIADLASANPGGLFLFDSYTKLTSKLGLKESANTYAGPAEDVREVCARHSITLVVLHHSGHSRQGEGEVAASRSTALPAFSQVINLTWFKRKESKTDKRVLLETEGREEDLQLLILQNTGGWTRG